MLSHNIYDVLHVKAKRDFTSGTWLCPFKCLNWNLSSARDIHRQFPSLFILFIPPVIFFNASGYTLAERSITVAVQSFFLCLNHLFLHKLKEVGIFKYFYSTASVLPDEIPYRNTLPLHSGVKVVCPVQQLELDIKEVINISIPLNSVHRTKYKL